MEDINFEKCQFYDLNRKKFIRQNIRPFLNFFHICHDKSCHIKTYFVKPTTARGVLKSRKVMQSHPLGDFFLPMNSFSVKNVYTNNDILLQFYLPSICLSIRLLIKIFVEIFSYFYCYFLRFYPQSQ